MDQILGSDEFITCENGLRLHYSFSGLSLIIEDDTTIDMIIEAWWEIKNHRKRLSSKFGPSVGSKNHQRLFLRSWRKLEKWSYRELAKNLNENIRYFLSRGENDEAVDLMVHWGIKRDKAIEIANDGVDSIMDDYPFDKNRTVSFIRYLPEYLEEE